MSRLSVSLSLCLLASCASAGDPPGGPPDTTPPKIVAVTPDSGAIDSVPPKEVDIRFDEVINERVASAKGDIGSAILLSPLDPDTVAPKVEWHRDHITIVPKHGFRPGRVYRVELLPVIADLRTNRMRQGRVILFSTGPDIPHAELHGTLVDWGQARPVTQGLVEAFDVRDSLTYRALTDSVGNFRLQQVPPGDYLVFGTVDQNNDRRRGPREAFDSVRVTVPDSTPARAELYAFTHDTTGPRIRRVEATDSLTLRLTFTSPLDPATPFDTSRVHIAPYADSTALEGVAAVLTTAGMDSLRAAERARADSLNRLRADSIARARADSLARAHPADTTRRAPAAAPAPPARPGVRPDTTRRDTTRRGQPGGQRPQLAPRDSTLAQKMLARRPPPSDTRVIRLTAPLVAGSRYFLCADSARSISLLWGEYRCNQFVAPRPPPPRARARGDTTRVDTLRADTLRHDTTASRRDTTAAPRDTTRADTTRRDTTRARRDSTLQRLFQ